MTASVNTNISYVSTRYASEPTLWRRVILAVQSIFSKGEVVVHAPGYIPFETTRKETAPFDPYMSKVAFDLNRIV